ncbi:MAG: hypothetical protein JXB34_01300 [Bacteroidales bacterium]|nr:hypothetical protein [Bacteroidales bacterium]
MKKSSTLAGALFVYLACTFGQADSINVSAGKAPNRANAESFSDETDNELPLRVYTARRAKIAMFSSAVVPGLGQAYNGKIWKIPLIYGAGTLLYYSYEYNNNFYQRLKSAYNDEAVKNADPQLKDLSNQTIDLKMNDYRRQRDLTVIGFGLLYVVNVVDAMIDSYMLDYDISKDLSMKVSPTMLQPSPDAYFATCGLKMSLRF